MFKKFDILSSLQDQQTFTDGLDMKISAPNHPTPTPHMAMPKAGIMFIKGLPRVRLDLENTKLFQKWKSIGMLRTPYQSKNSAMPPLLEFFPYI